MNIQTVVKTAFGYRVTAGGETLFVPEAEGNADFARVQTWLAAGHVVDDEPAPTLSLAPLSPRRFWLAALSLGITEEMVDAKIETLPEPQRSAARIEKRHAQTYERSHMLVASLPAQFGITAAALDAAWTNAPA